MMLQKLKASLRARAGRLVASALKPPAAVLPTDYGDGGLLIHVDSEVERDVRTIPCAKEPDTIKWIHSLIKPGETVFDVGANVGNYSLIIAKHLSGNVKVYAFEPAWFNFTQLNRNIALNRYESSIFPICAGLSARSGLVWLNYSTLEYGSSMHSLGEAVRLRDQSFTPVLCQPVASFTLDQVVGYLEVTPNHIKIDVDGIESEILAGAAATLKNPALRSILVELSRNSQSDSDAIDRVLSAGFKIWNVQEKPRNAFVNYAEHANYIFVRE
jgi:FkbM family methyltransferase